jgi:leader peptidase (prepilin peptidase)/N-methyltransferase
MSASQVYGFLRSQPIGWGILAVAGALLGSFINVVIYRLPRGLSLVWPGSHCPRCGKSIAAYDNLPIVSFLLLRGRCRRCRMPISPRYPLVEALGAALTLGIALQAGNGLGALIGLVFALALLAVLFIDYDFQIIPDVITLPGIALGLLATLLSPLSIRDSLLGVVIGGGGLFLVAAAYHRVARREGLGMGDVKLMAMVGAFLGWRGAVATLVLGSLAGSLVGGVLIASRRGSRHTALPFGSFLAPAAWAALLFGEWLWRAYLHVLHG